MSTKEQLIYIKDSLDKRIESVNKKRIFYRKWSFIVLFSTAFLAIISSILLGLNSKLFAEATRITVLIITSIISLISVVNAFFNYKELWLANNTARNRFYELKFKIELFEKSEENSSLAIIESFANVYQEIINDLNQSWIKARNDSSQNKSTATNFQSTPDK